MSLLSTKENVFTGPSEVLKAQRSGPSFAQAEKNASAKPRRALGDITNKQGGATSKDKETPASSNKAQQSFSDAKSVISLKKDSSPAASKDDIELQKDSAIGLESQDDLDFLKDFDPTEDIEYCPPKEEPTIRSEVSDFSFLEPAIQAFMNLKVEIPQPPPTKFLRKLPEKFPLEPISFLSDSDCTQDDDQVVDEPLAITLERLPLDVEHLASAFSSMPVEEDEFDSDYDELDMATDESDERVVPPEEHVD